MIDRRDFLKSTAAAAVASRVWGSSERITGAFIGTGRQGRGNMSAFLRQEDFPVAVAAICDVYEPNAREALKLCEDRKVPAPDVVKDYRRIFDRKDIDVIFVGSPDHWHALQTAQACQAGKDVYVEKSISVRLQEGRKMVEAARKYNRVVQVGTQQRSGKHFQKAVQLIWEGAIGKIAHVKTWNYGNEFPKGIGNPPDSDPPPDLDWDMWLGPAPLRPFNANRFGVNPKTFFYFRWFWDYAGGMMTDWGVHLLDIVQWALRADGPRSVTATGGKFLLQDNRETPDTLMVTYEYPGCVVTYENVTTNNHGIDTHGYGITFYGTEGTLFVDRGGFKLTPQTTRIRDRVFDLIPAVEMKDLPDSHTNHVVNFLECVRSRQRPISDIEIGHRSTSTCLLGNIAYRTKERLEWDPAAERFTRGSAQASALLAYDYRKPWVLSV